MPKVTVQCEASSTRLTFHFFPERVGIRDQLNNAISISGDDFRKIVAEFANGEKSAKR
jgi:hypothetical protein